ncbi:hypothetical protein TNCV_684391 [Trichonephila clavipes]|nr:hypothetical protein TNCV_684391 [Trichonephila clavipes]
MHPLLENINLFVISSLTEENVKDILTEARVLPEKTSPPVEMKPQQIEIPAETLTDDNNDDEVPFVDDEDGDPNWEEF